MKNILLIVLAIFSLMSCSSSKEVAHQSSGLKEVPTVKSYGAHGRIVYTEVAEEAQLKSSVAESTVQLNVDADMPHAKTVSTRSESLTNTRDETKVAHQEKELVQSESAASTEDLETNGSPKNKEEETGNKEKNWLAITGFIFSFFFLFLIPIPFAILFSIKGLKSQKRGFAIAGLVITFLWLVFSIFYLLGGN